MKNAASTLISPFDKIWRDLAAQTSAWVTVNRLLTQAMGLPARIEEVRAALNEDIEKARAKIDGNLTVDTKAMAAEAYALVLLQHDAIVYPGLIGAWAVVEASFDDLIKTILTNDPDATEKLQKFGIKTEAHHPVGTEEWVEMMYRRLENKAKATSKGHVVEIHKASFGALGIVFDYPADRSRVIEELNQVRNSILHSQGVITSRAVTISPRLAQYLGLAIPTSDPIFAVSLTMLHNYTTAWIASLVHSPYLNSGLISGAKNPFS
jgi:hypothetical protein